jgi:hypothetical protein
MNGALVSAGADGLRVEVAPGRDWAIAAVPAVALPAGIASVRVRVAALGGGGRWLSRVHGDVRGAGEASTASLFGDRRDVGWAEMELDPRLLQTGPGTPVQLQLGLEGPPGAYAVFGNLQFAVGPARMAPPVISGQCNLAAVDLMPNLPQPYQMRDWRALARAYDRFVFDFGTRGEHLPLVWLDESRVNIDRPCVGLSSYVGDGRRGGARHEGINTMGAVLGATVSGIDKRRQAHDYVAMCEAYYGRRSGLDLVLNDVEAGTGGSFWYEIWPSILFAALADRYPDARGFDAMARTVADRWAEATARLTGPDGVAEFDHTAFDFRTMRPVDNGQWREPDAAAGVAWLTYTAWTRTRDPRHLAAAEACLRFLDQRRDNPYYEVLLPWGALTAARLNAELGRSYNVPKLLEWCFGISACRGGWGVVVNRWGGYDCHGLVGSVDNRGGYAFTMNTFAQAAALVPLVRYDTRYARAIGKWMLNLANASRLFYPTAWPADQQSSAFWKGDPLGVIAYEGLRREWDGKTPYATGDPLAMKWGPKTDLGLYGSSYVGLLGGIVHTANVEGVLALDCLATDFCRTPAYPTWLVYNPHGEPKSVRLPLAGGRPDLYDAASGRYLARAARADTAVTVPSDHALVVVALPAGSRLERAGRVARVNGVVADYGLSHP